MPINFRRGTDVYSEAGVFTAGSLPDSEKERLCRSLLAEFGVTSVKASGNGELLHSCVLPFGGHKNGDRTPSAYLNYKKLTYHCWACDSSGGLLWFIAVCRGTSSTDAAKWLGQESGVTDDAEGLSALLRFLEEIGQGKKNDLYAPIPKLSPKMLNQWALIHPYLTEIRKIKEETIEQFRVGYGTFDIHLGDGVFRKSDRIIIPHFWKGDLVGWQTRRLINDGTSKYSSSPDMPKDQTIYNYDPRRAVVVVESPMSVLALAHRTPVVEATFGASVTDRQIKLIAEHKRVILWFDNDEAGWKATLHVGAALERYSDVWVVDSNYAADPADLVSEDMEDTALELIAQPIPFAVWKLPTSLVSLEKEVVPA